MRVPEEKYRAAGAIGWSLLLLCMLGTAGHADVWFGEPIMSEADQASNIGILGDLDHDGFTDLVTSPWGHDNPPALRYQVFLGDGLGHMELVQLIPGGASSTRDFALIDDNADGFLDLAVRGGSYLNMWHNDGTGHFEFDQTRSFAPGPYAVGDLDGDEYADLVSTNPNYDGLRIVYGTPTGLDWPNMQTVWLEVAGITVDIKWVEVMDLDGDSHPDVVTCGAAVDAGTEVAVSAVVAWRYGLGNREFSDPHHYYWGEPDESFTSFDAADVDLDEDQDLVCARSGFTSYLLLYNHDEETLEFGGDPFGSGGGVRFARIDQDEVPDCVQFPYAEAFRGVGDGSFELVQELPTFRGLLGQIIGNDGPDLISFDYYDGIIGVWNNLAYEPAGIPPIELASPVSLRANPSIASRFVQLVRSVSTAETGALQILDIRGRVVRTLAIDGPMAVWNLKSDRGEEVDSGVYWIRPADGGGTDQATRVTVVR